MNTAPLGVARSVGRAALIALCACTSSAVRPVAEPSTRDLSWTLGQLERAFVDSVRANGVIGAQLAVSIPGQPLWTSRYGVDAPGRPMTDDALLGTGSISKMLAAVAALRVMEQGRFTLDDTLGRWFPGVRNVPGDLTIRFLLWNQSGLPDYGSAATFGPAVLADRGRNWQPEELLGFIGPADFARGSGWHASNTDRLLLSIIGARERGLPYGEYLRRELFAVPEAEVWTPGEQHQRVPRLATHWSRGASGEAVDFSASTFGPSLFTSRLETYLSTRELARFARRLFEGDLLSAESRRHLLTFVPDDGRIGGQNGGGVGVRRFSYLGRVLYGNSGATANSSAMYLYDPGTGVIVSMSTNSAGALHRSSHFNIVPALVREANAFVETRRALP